jgi:adhesin HecA-like repeat protein
LVSPTRDWVAGNTPNIVNFTNRGTFFVENNAEMGTDRLAAYQRFENSGLVDVDSFQLRTRELDNSGTISSVEDTVIDVESGKVDGGTILAGGDIEIAGSGVKFRNSTLSMGGTLYLSVRDNLEDGGIASPNIFAPGFGFQVLTRPVSGNLFGTEIDLTTAQFVNVVNVSAAEDRGATVAGFSNNAAIGRLVVTTGFDGLQTFAGTGISNALYVDFLNLAWTTTAAIEANMAFAPNLVMYFADSNVPAEQLDGLFGGHLQWVRDFAGPNSSVDVILPNGQTIQVNRSLRNSTTIDSDSDGIPNGLDPSPFDNLVLAAVSVVNQPSPNTVALSWKAAAGSVYDVQYASSFDSTDWQTLTTFTNSEPVNRTVTVYDPSAASATQQRFYRLRLRLGQ